MAAELLAVVQLNPARTMMTQTTAACPMQPDHLRCLRPDRILGESHPPFL
jgi:hypothetical protein